MPYHLRPNQVILKDHCKETLRLNKLTNVTDNPRYHHVVSLLHIIRRQLLNNRSYREPYLDILLDIYDLGTPKTKKRIRKTRPTRPTDLDIRQFLYSQWPEIILRSTEMSDTSYNWAFTVGWTLMEGESTIYMSHDFVSHLQRKASTALSDHRQCLDFSVPFQAVVGRNYGASFDQLNLLFISLIIRAMADRIVMWWSGGCLELPDCLPYSAGLCVEKWFFGGVIQGWWLDGQFGSLRKLGGISLEASACNSIIGMCQEIIINSCTSENRLHSRPTRRHTDPQTI